MPDGRFLSKTVAHDWELNNVSLEADYLFARCIPHLDVEGRMPGHPGQVKAIAVPLRVDMTPESVDRALGELAAVGLVEWYKVGGRPWLQFPGFTRHQKGLRKNREADSTIPERTDLASAIETVLGHSGVDPEDSGVGPAQVRSKSEETSQVVTGHQVRSGSGVTPEDSRLSKVKSSQVKTSTTGARDDPKSAMEAHLATALEEAPPVNRKRLEAQARLIIAGEDKKAWETETGDQVPEADRPELFQLALGYHRDGTQNALRSSVRYVVKLYTQEDRAPPNGRQMGKAERKLANRIAELRGMDLSTAFS